MYTFEYEVKVHVYVCEFGMLYKGITAEQASSDSIHAGWYYVPIYDAYTNIDILVYTPDVGSYIFHGGIQ
jgi:hypothetical protein